MLCPPGVPCILFPNSSHDRIAKTSSFPFPFAWRTLKAFLLQFLNRLDLIWRTAHSINIESTRDKQSGLPRTPHLPCWTV